MLSNEELRLIELIDLDELKKTSLKPVFIELQNSTGMNNIKCARYLGITEGAVKDRRLGRFNPRRCELIALAVKGSSAQLKAAEYIDHLIAEKSQT